MPGMTRMGMVAALLAVATGAAGCGSSGEAGSLDSTDVVCDEFAAYAADGQPAEDREAVVASIGEVIGNADADVADRYNLLVNAQDGSDEAWTTAADAFAQACFDAGWEG